MNPLFPLVREPLIRSFDFLQIAKQFVCAFLLSSKKKMTDLLAIANSSSPDVISPEGTECGSTRGPGRVRSIDKAITMLPQCQLNTMPGLQGQYMDLTEAIVSVLRDWRRCWDTVPEARSILNKSNMPREIEESVVPIKHVLDLLDRHFHRGNGEQAGESSRIVLMDVCSGKGYLSLLLSFLLPHYPELLGQVDRIVMVDSFKNGGEGTRSTKFGGGIVNMDHLKLLDNPVACGELPHIPIQFHQLNIHEEAFVELINSGSPTSSVVMAGIHLCSTLAARLIECFNRCPRAIGMVLAPCCLPSKGTSAIKIRNAAGVISTMIDVKTVYAANSPAISDEIAAAEKVPSGDPYCERAYVAWVDALVNAVDSSWHQTRTIPLVSSVNGHRRNAFILAIK